MSREMDQTTRDTSIGGGKLRICVVAAMLLALISVLGSGRAIAQGWTVETVQEEGNFDFGYHVSLALDESTGTPHLCYNVQLDRACLIYAVREDGIWVHEIADSAEGIETGLGCEIAVDSNGEPHIAYKGQYPLGVRYAHKSGEVWMFEDVPSTNYSVGWMSIALDSSDRPRISYIDQTAGSVILASRNGTWTTEVVDPMTGNSTSLVIDSDDRPHVSYIGSGGLRYAEKTGGSWSLETVETAASLGHTALALDGLGRPHIAYRQSGSPRLVHYAHKSGETWIIEHNVFSEQLGGNSVSLALDSAGVPHLAEGKAPPHQLTHATKSGGTWVYEDVDFAGGSYTDVVIDQSGVMHVGYQMYDYPQDAKYAFKALQVEPIVGACCVPATGECYVIDETDCLTMTGTWDEEGVCIPTPCVVPTEPAVTAGRWARAEPWHDWVSNVGEGGIPLQARIPSHAGAIDYVDFFYSTDGGSIWEFISTDTDGSEPALNTFETPSGMNGCGWASFFEFPDSSFSGPIMFKSVAYPYQGEPIENITSSVYDPAPPSMGRTNLEDFVVVDLDALGIEVMANGTDIERIIVHAEWMEEIFTKGVPGISQQPHSVTHCAPTAAAQCLKYFEAQGDTAVTATLDDFRLTGALAAYMSTNQSGVAGTLPSNWVGGLDEWIGDYGVGHTVRYFVHYNCEMGCTDWTYEDWVRVRNELHRCQDVLLGVFWDGGGGHAMTLNSIVYPNLPNDRILIGFKDPWTGDTAEGELDPETGYIYNLGGAGGGGGGQIGLTVLVSPTEGSVAEGGPGDPLYDGLPAEGPPYEIAVDLPDQYGYWFVHVTIVNTSGHSHRITRLVHAPNPQSDVDDIDPKYLAFRLNRCTPNPFQAVTEVSYTVPTQAWVALTIHDLAGRKVRTLHDGDVGPGSHTVLWDGRDSQGRQVSSGIYYVKMKSSEFERTKKITVLR